MTSGIDFDGTKFAFLESVPFMIALAVGFALLIVAERRVGPDRLESGGVGATISAFGPALGALAVRRRAGRRLRRLVARRDRRGPVRARSPRPRSARCWPARGTRLDAGAAAALPVYAEGVGLLLAAAAVLLPPLGLIGLVFLVALLVTGRRRGEQKYAGLRVLR